MNALNICSLIAINQHVFMKQIKPTSLKLYRTLLSRTSNFDLSLIKLDYLRPLYKNEYSINDTHKFSIKLSSIPPLQDDEEDVSYDVKSLFTNIPIQETINYITEQIYVHKKFTLIFPKLIFRRLLIKLAT